MTAVEWTEPDETRRRPARLAAERDRQAMVSPGVEPGLREFARVLRLADSEDERDELWIGRYPDLGATMTRRGVLLSVAHQPEQWGLQFGDKLRTSPVRLCVARWTALVMTDDGCVEMDPSRLRPASP